MTRKRRPGRRGYALIEMVLVIGGLTIILSLCGGLLHTLLRLDRAGRDSLSDATTLARLARQFRQDVRASREAKPGGPGSLELTRPDGPSVSYRIEAGRLLREEREKGAVRRRESYGVTRLGPVAFDADGSIVRLMLEKRPAGPVALARPAVMVEAALDKDRATARNGGDQK
jgi:hypothetical protein